MTQQTYHSPKLPLELSDQKRKQKPSITKILIVIIILFAFVPLVCFTTWSVVSLNTDYNLIEYGRSETGEYYTLSTTEDDGFAIQWRVGYLGKWGAFTIWKWGQESKEGDNYSYILWRITWPPLQIE